ncbi:XdhC family protein [Clostridium sp. JNZ X4-2]
MEDKILKQIYESLYRGEQVALAIITNIRGSTPRKSGSMMAVWKDGKISGSVGGGSLEHKIILKSIECIKENTQKEFSYNLTENGELDARCGGELHGFIKLFTPKPRLIIAGAGHIGKYLFKFGKLLGFHTAIFDDREEITNDDFFKDSDEIIQGNIGENLSKYPMDKSTYVIIVTKGHKDDFKALKAVVLKDTAYTGMIGSTKKILFILNKLIEEGVPKDTLEKVYTPIGVNIASEKPEEIAFSILSEILLIKNKGSLKHLKDIKKINL